MIDISREVVAIEPWEECARFVSSETSVTFLARRHDRNDAQELMTYSVMALLMFCMPALWHAQNPVVVLPWMIYGWLVCAAFIWIPSRSVSLTISPRRKFMIRRPGYFFRTLDSQGEGAHLVCGRVTFVPSLALRTPVYVVALRKPGAFFFSLACSPDRTAIGSALKGMECNLDIREEEFECSGISRRSRAAIVSRLLFRARHKQPQIVRDGRLQADVAERLRDLMSEASRTIDGDLGSQMRP